MTVISLLCSCWTVFLCRPFVASTPHTPHTSHTHYTPSPPHIPTYSSLVPTLTLHTTPSQSRLTTPIELAHLCTDLWQCLREKNWTWHMESYWVWDSNNVRAVYNYTCACKMSVLTCQEGCAQWAYRIYFPLFLYLLVLQNGHSKFKEQQIIMW